MSSQPVTTDIWRLSEVFDLMPKLGIFAASLFEERLTLLGRALQRGMEEFL